MHVCFLSQYFPPEVNAPANRLWDNARQWVRAGHTVTVLTVFPHHPTGIVPPAYRRKWLMREKREGVNIVRTFVYPAPNRGVLKRTLAYLSAMLSMVLLGPFVVRRPDVLVATSPQFFIAVAGFVLSRLKNVPFVLEIRDLWPESIVAVGALRPNPGLRALQALADFLYRNADHVVVVTNSFRKFITRRGVPDSRITVIKNGVVPEDFSRPTDTAAIRRELGLEGAFVASYIGTHGMAHGLDKVLRAAQILKDDPRIRFLLVGEGAEKANLLRLKESLGLSNVVMLGQQPHDRAIQLLVASDAAIVPLRKSEVFKTVLPSKIPEAMAAGVPILLSVEGEARELVEEAGAGICVAPDDSAAMAEALRKLASQPELARSLADNGRAFVRGHLDRTVLAQRYARALETVVRSRTGRNST